jgi:hypothetical protein
VSFGVLRHMIGVMWDMIGVLWDMIGVLSHDWCDVPLHTLCVATLWMSQYCNHIKLVNNLILNKLYTHAQAVLSMYIIRQFFLKADFACATLRLSRSVALPSGKVALRKKKKPQIHWLHCLRGFEKKCLLGTKRGWGSGAGTACTEITALSSGRSLQNTAWRFTVPARPYAIGYYTVKISNTT